MIFFLITITAFQWALVNVMMSYARHAKGHTEHFYIVGGAASFISTVLCGLIFKMPLLPEEPSFAPFLCVVLGACMNACTNMCIMYTLGFDASALYLALTILGFSVSFLWSVIVWGEQMSFTNAIGLLSLVIAVFCSALAKQTKGKAVQKQDFLTKYKRLLIALFGTLMGGSAQIMFIVPCGKSPLPPLGKTACITLTYVILFSIVIYVKKMKSRPDFVMLSKSAIPWGILALTSYLTLFMTVDRLTAIGRSGIAFPIGATLQILFFTLYTRIFLKEKLTKLQIAALIFIIIGILAIRL